MELELGDFEGLVDTSTSSAEVTCAHDLAKVKECEVKWFLCNSQSSDADEDEIKFQADFYFYRKKYSSALQLYHKLMTCRKYGSTRSLLAEVYESLAICYRKLGDTEQALLFSTKSEAIGKSSDHRITSLFIKTQTMPATSKTDELKRLLLLHPYNHAIWFQFAFLHADARPLALYLLRVSSLLHINSRNTASFVAERHEDMRKQVEKSLLELSQKLGECTINSFKKWVKDQDKIERLKEEWQNEDYKTHILNSSVQKITSLFHQKWSSALDDID
ncbi:uncharacterized protein [Watersipora subatra]|uniref:uncharacterized protein isoform X2 n=1 Tax=Watersipora subatra TaxID=2589382 RepID=UPI00355BEC87